MFQFKEVGKDLISSNGPVLVLSNREEEQAIKSIFQIDDEFYKGTIEEVSISVDNKDIITLQNKQEIVSLEESLSGKVGEILKFPPGPNSLNDFVTINQDFNVSSLILEEKNFEKYYKLFEEFPTSSKGKFRSLMKFLMDIEALPEFILLTQNQLTERELFEFLKMNSNLIPYIEKAIYFLEGIGSEIMIISEDEKVRILERGLEIYHPYSWFGEGVCTILREFGIILNTLFTSYGGIVLWKCEDFFNKFHVNSRPYILSTLGYFIEKECRENTLLIVSPVVPFNLNIPNKQDPINYFVFS